MNNLITAFNDHNLILLSAIVFLIMTIYLLVVAVKGNATYGFRFACFTFYPVHENET